MPGLPGVDGHSACKPDPRIHLPSPTLPPGFGYTDPGFGLRFQGLLLFDAYERALWQVRLPTTHRNGRRAWGDAACAVLPWGL